MLTKQIDPIVLLKVCCALIFVGNGLAFVSGPSSLGYAFENAESVQISFGFGLILVSPLLLFSREKMRAYKLHYGVLLATAILSITTYCSFVKAGFVPEQLLENGIQLLVPIALFWVIQSEKFDRNQLSTLLKIAIAFTFIGHGLFALGVHYVPAGFVDMTTKLLGITNANARIFLFIIGILDLVCAVLIFFKFNVKYAYVYLILWGLITALARISYGVLIIEGSVAEFSYWMANTLYRIPHGLVAIIVWRHTRLHLTDSAKNN